MKTWMLRVLTFAAATAAGCIGIGASYEGAASPSPSVFNAVAAPTLVEETGWRRQWRRGYGAPVVVAPNPGVAVDPDVEIESEVDVEVDVEAGPPAVILLPPPRPASCGQYRYWNGERCVDARYNDPYLGPR